MAEHIQWKERPGFYHLGMLVHATVAVRKGVENNFHNYGGPVKLS